MEGLEANEALGYFESCDPAIGLTPQELIERQESRGKLAMMRLSKEKAVAREGAALKREKLAYARALGAAASSQAIDMLRQERSGTEPFADGSSSARGGQPPERWAERRWAEAPEQGELQRPSPGSDGAAAVDEFVHAEATRAPGLQRSASFGSMSMSARGRMAAGLSAGMLAARSRAPAEFEKLHAGEAIVPPHSSGDGQLERALERGRAAREKRATEEATASRQAEEQRKQRQYARQLGSAASLLAIDQLRNEATNAGAPAAAPAGSTNSRGKRSSAAFGSSTRRDVSPLSTAAKRSASPARPLSPRLLRPTEASKRSAEERRQTTASRGGETPRGAVGACAASDAACRAGGDSSCEATALRSASGSCSSHHPTSREHMLERRGLLSARGAPRHAEPGALAAVHDLATALSPQELYRTLAAQRAQGVGVGSSGQLGKNAPPAVRAAAKKAAKALLDATGALDPAAPSPSYAPTPSAAALVVQSGYRGYVGRCDARRCKAARGLQRAARQFVARRRRMHARNRARLYSQQKQSLHFSRRIGEPPTELAAAVRLASEEARDVSRANAAEIAKASSIKGKWAERNPAPVLNLPMSRSLAKAPPSPSGRPTHQRLHEQANERQERMRERGREQAERLEQEHIATCTFSPMTNGKEGRARQAQSGMAGRWKSPSTAAQRDTPRTAASQPVRGVFQAKEDASVQVWTTVASTGG